MSWKVLQGDCIEVMATLKEASIDAVVCDPPYGIGFMGHEWDQPGVEHRAGPGAYEQPPAPGRTAPRSNGSMEAGKYDLSLSANQRYQAWCEAWACEAFRVLKPGGHLLASCGTRTYHRLAAGIEDAGFEIRDSVMWMYGSGFPKSLDVSKAIDRKDDARRPEREAVGRWLREQREAAGLKQKDVAAHWPSVTGGLTGCVANWEGGFNCPTLEQWADLKRIIGLSDDMDAEVWRLNGRKGQPGENWEKREVIGRRDRGFAPGTNAVFGAFSGDDRVTAPATPEAIQWQGWGTALKPSHEPIVVARKPLICTVAQNVLEHGTGGINVDGCRIGTTKDVPASPRRAAQGAAYGDLSNDSGEGSGWDPAVGRWPANVVLSEEAAAELDAQSGESVSRQGKPRAGTNGEGWGMTATGAEYDDSGGASRFFYCAKTSRAERNAGLEGFEAQEKQQRYGDNFERGRNPETGERTERMGRTTLNTHPTVKPINLMRWLCRLVTPPGGTVLDPFTGSGSTGAAAVLEGFEFTGIEREADYIAIAKARIEFWAQYEGREVEEVLEAIGRSQRAEREHRERGQTAFDLTT